MKTRIEIKEVEILDPAHANIKLELCSVTEEDGMSFRIPHLRFEIWQGIVRVGSFVSNPIGFADCKLEKILSDGSEIIMDILPEEQNKDGRISIPDFETSERIEISLTDERDSLEKQVDKMKVPTRENLLFLAKHSEQAFAIAKLWAWAKNQPKRLVEGFRYMDGIRYLEELVFAIADERPEIFKERRGSYQCLPFSDSLEAYLTMRYEEKEVLEEMKRNEIEAETVERKRQIYQKGVETRRNNLIAQLRPDIERLYQKYGLGLSTEYDSETFTEFNRLFEKFRYLRKQDCFPEILGLLVILVRMYPAPLRLSHFEKWATPRYQKIIMAEVAKRDPRSFSKFLVREKDGRPAKLDLEEDWVAELVTTAVADAMLFNITLMLEDYEDVYGKGGSNDLEKHIQFAATRSPKAAIRFYPEYSGHVDGEKILVIALEGMSIQDLAKAASPYGKLVPQRFIDEAVDKDLELIIDNLGKARFSYCNNFRKRIIHRIIEKHPSVLIRAFSSKIEEDDGPWLMNIANIVKDHSPDFLDSLPTCIQKATAKLALITAKRRDAAQKLAARRAAEEQRKKNSGAWSGLKKLFGLE